MSRIEEIELRHVRAQGLQLPLGWCRACSEDWPCDSAYLFGQVKRLREQLAILLPLAEAHEHEEEYNCGDTPRSDAARAALSDEGSET